LNTLIVSNKTFFFFVQTNKKKKKKKKKSSGHRISFFVFFLFNPVIIIGTCESREKRTCYSFLHMTFFVSFLYISFLFIFVYQWWWNSQKLYKCVTCLKKMLEGICGQWGRLYWTKSWAPPSGVYLTCCFACLLGVTHDYRAVVAEKIKGGAFSFCYLHYKHKRTKTK
jgi:hypothetical protein